MNRDFLEENWEVSSYNEDTDEQLDYYIDESQCAVGDKAYLYSHEDEELHELEIVHIIARSDDAELYDGFDEDVLLDGESEYEADASAEFFTANDCYLVWFRYAE